MNENKLSSSRFDGLFYANKHVVLDGDNVVGWKVLIVYNSGEKKEIIVSGNTFAFTMPNCKSMSITSIVGTNSIESISGIDIYEASSFDVFDLSGSQIKKVKNGLNIIKNNDGTFKKEWRK